MHIMSPFGVTFPILHSTSSSLSLLADGHRRGESLTDESQKQCEERRQHLDLGELGCHGYILQGKWGELRNRLSSLFGNLRAKPCHSYSGWENVSVTG